MRYFLLAFVCVLIFLPSAVSAALNAGFVQGLWFSNYPVFAEKPVRIYVALRNNTDSDLTGTVRFYDGDSLIGTKNISAVEGRLVEAWTDWVPTYGDHTLKAELASVEIQKIGFLSETATVTSALAEQSLFVDNDTDDDGIGNKEDDNDDNDPYTDEEEVANGTDPLVYDEPEPEPEATTTEGVEKEVTEENGTNDTRAPDGLETFTNPGPVDDLLAQVTNTINTTKDSLDEYREERTNRQRNIFGGGVHIKETNRSQSGEVGETDGNAEEDRATKVDEGPGLLQRAVSVLVFVVDAVYTLALALLSLILSVPAVVELLLLLLILYGVYRTARHLGRRPQ